RVVAALHAPGEAGPVGDPQPLLARAAEQVDPLVDAGELGDQAGGPVRAGVVDDQDLDPLVGADDLADHGLDRLGLVVGGDDDQRSHGVPGVAGSWLAWRLGASPSAGRRRLQGSRENSGVAAAPASRTASTKWPARAYSVRPLRGWTVARTVVC